MTNCEQYRLALAARFDAAEDLSGAGEHAAYCAECAAYRDELLALTRAFRAMPLEIPRSGFEAVLKAKLAAEATPANDVRWWLPATAIIACLIIGIAAWYYAVPVDLTQWQVAVNESAAMLSFDGSDWAQEVATWSAWWDGVAQLLARISGPALWAAAAAAFALFIVFNGVEARRTHLMTRRRS